MRTRKDGEATKRRILEAACRVFSEKGYHEATHAEICKRAQANIAAINYHFGGKEDLYRAVWQHTIDLFHNLYPIAPGETSDEPAENKLRRFILLLLRKYNDHDQLGYSHRLHLQEMWHPSGVVDDLLVRRRAPYQERLLSIMRELLGPLVPNEVVRLCEKSVIGQCHSLRFGPNEGPHQRGKPLDDANIEKLAEHITRFSLGGIAAAREKLL